MFCLSPVCHYLFDVANKVFTCLSKSAQRNKTFMKSLVLQTPLQLKQKDDIKTRFVASVLHLIWKVLCLLMILCCNCLWGRLLFWRKWAPSMIQGWQNLPRLLLLPSVKPESSSSCTERSCYKQAFKSNIEVSDDHKNQRFVQTFKFIW